MLNKTPVNPTASEFSKLFSEPRSGVPFDIDDDQDAFLCTLLVSARLRVEEQPFPKILDINLHKQERTITDETTGLLLIEARDAAEPAFGNVAHLAVSVEAGSAQLLEIDVRESHRGIRVPEVILALASILTNVPVGPDAHDPYPEL